MKTKQEAYNKAEEVDLMIARHVNTQPKYLTKFECYNLMLYVRTIRTSLDILDVEAQSRIDSLELESKK